MSTKLQEILLSAKKLLNSYKLSQIQLSDKSLIQFDGDELKTGIPVNLVINSKPSPLPDGSYKTLDGVSFSIEKGVVSKVDNSKSTEQLKTEPVQQAQSSQKFSFADPGYQKDKKQRYPIDTEEHIRAAWNYINKKEDAAQYTPEQLKSVKERIIAAWKKDIDPKGPPSADAQAAADDDKKGRVTVEPPKGGEDLTPTDTVDDLEDAAADSTTDDSTADDSTPLTAKTLMDALQPLMESIKNIETTMCGEMNKHTAMNKELKDTREALNNVTEVVEVLAGQPSTKAIEAKKNPFKKEDELSNTRLYKIFHANEQ